MDFDLVLFSAINNFAPHTLVVAYTARFFAEYYQYLLVAILLSFWIWPKKDQFKNRRMVLTALLSAVIARVLVKTFILLFYTRERPYVVLENANQLISVRISENLNSFPSGHAIFFFAMAAAVYFFNKKLGIFFFISAAIMGLARIFAGVHWPSDIIGGAILGIIVGALGYEIYLKSRR